MTMRPNILMIVTDQEYAHQALPTSVTLPNRNRLHNRGVTFNHHQVTTTVCTPSRSVMWTGQHTPFTRMIDNTNLAWIEDMRSDPETLPTIGHMLRELGYYTAYKGKWHESEFAEGDTTDAMEPFGFADFQGWGDAYGEPLDGFTKDPKTAVEAVHWLKTRSAEIADKQPWFLAVNFINPHDIMYFDTDDEEMVHVRGMFPIFGAPESPLYSQQWPTTLPASFFDDLDGQPQAVRNYKVACDGTFGRIPVERRDLWHNHVNYYINCMVDVDKHIGTLLDALESSGQEANTIIIFTSDHGEMGGAHHLRQKGSVAFKEIVNVPMIIVDPKLPGGLRTNTVGSHLDLVPTILSYAGLHEDEQKQRYPFIKGHDLSGVVADPRSDGPRGSSKNPGKGALYTYDMIASVDAQWLQRNAPILLDSAAAEAGIEFTRGKEFLDNVKNLEKPNMDNRELFRGMFDGRYKFVRYFGLAHYNQPRSIEELFKNNDVALYDLQMDPEEMINLANQDNPNYDEELLKTMNAKLNALIEAEIGEDNLIFMPPQSE
ncbi:MAG: sulfatase-like hydrolase/transferase [Chloroflexota bacterium]|nr:MAG: sulfatase-like hydrolase/transferase [Chloroflexota bacterium]